MTDNLIKRLTAGATGAGNLPKDLYRKDCADALAEIERLRAALCQIADGDAHYDGAAAFMKIATEALSQQSTENK